MNNEDGEGGSSNPSPAGKAAMQMMPEAGERMTVGVVSGGSVAAGPVGGGPVAGGPVAGGPGVGGMPAPAPNCLTIDNLTGPTIFPPAGIRLGFRLLDCDGRAVRRLNSAEVTIIDNERGEAFGASGEGGSISGLVRPPNLVCLLYLRWISPIQFLTPMR